MFDSLSDRLQRVMKGLRGEGHLTEFHVDEALKEIRTGLLEADVHLDVVKGFTQRVREKAVGQEVLTAFAPAQQVLKIVQAELVGLLGGSAATLNLKRRPSVILLVGLQGSGKTTTAAKLGLHLKKKLGKQVLLVPADVHRPAATEQLRTLGKENGLPCYRPEGGDGRRRPGEGGHQGSEAFRMGCGHRRHGRSAPRRRIADGAKSRGFVTSAIPTRSSSWPTP